jgi:hypothetical protein
VSVNWFYTIRTQLLTYSTVPKDSQPASATSTTEAEKGIPPYSTIQETTHSATLPHDHGKAILPHQTSKAHSHCIVPLLLPIPVIQSTRYLSQQPASPVTILIATTSHKPEQTDRAVPSPCPLHVSRYTKTSPYLAPRTSLRPTTLRHHQSSTVTRQQTWLGK